ncbi:hypothetical protein TD95_004160 [Thielaviopsis punctulata]|uniref:DNA damage-binding protein 1 n=1 Tax=Thielaviopsis punctulata TaxID=72032 RepID=A0A0F4ZEF4_9PEZI|nr:hypothetical protein TD95_004160 [Thielaviopsis punctulata]
MAYFAPIHRPTSVRHSLTTRFTSEHKDSLVIAYDLLPKKACSKTDANLNSRTTNRLEVWDITDESVSLLDSRAINGTISSVSKLRPYNEHRDLLLIGTTAHNYVTLWWNDLLKHMEVVESITATPADFLRATESSNRAYTDPTGTFVALFLWEGVVSISRLSPKGKILKKAKCLSFLGQVRIPELFVKTVCFLPSTTGPRLAILYQTQNDNEDARLVIYTLTSDDRHMQLRHFQPRDREHMANLEDPHTSILIPVPKEEDENNRYHVRRGTAAQSRAYLGGVIAVGETTVVYTDGLSFETVKVYLSEATLFTSWAQLDTRTYILGDDYGGLHVLCLITEGTWVTRIQVEKFSNTTSRASTLSYLGNNLLYLGSHYADSQILRLNMDRLQFEILSSPNSFHNNAPILDFAIMDMTNRDVETRERPNFASGQARIVTGSGVWSDGSLRSIRSGINTEIYAAMDDFPNVQSLFAIRSVQSEKPDILLVSSLTDTRVFKFGFDGSIEELEFYSALNLGLPTLAAVNHSETASSIIQITSMNVSIVSGLNNAVESSWSPINQIISHGSCNGKFALVVVDGKSIYCLNVITGQEVQHTSGESASGGIDEQVACVSTSQKFPSIGVVGWWKTGIVALINLENDCVITTVSLSRRDGNVAFARDVCLAQVYPKNQAGPSLFVALEDGSVATYTLSPTDFSVIKSSVMIMGSRHARFHVLSYHGPLEGDERPVSDVLVTSDLSSLVYSEPGNDKLIYSATTLDDTTHAITFDSEIFPGAVVLASKGQLMIGVITRNKWTSINKLALGKTVRRLVHFPSRDAFVFTGLSKKVVRNEEVVEATLQLVGEISLEPLSEPFVLQHMGHVQVPESLQILEFEDSIDGHVERLVMGSSIVEADEAEAGGMLTVFGVDDELKPFALVSLALKSPISAVKVHGNLIIVGVSNGIRVFSYTEPSEREGHLQKIATRGSILSPTSIDVRNDIIGASDLTNSACFFKLDLTKAPSDRLKLIGKHRLRLWPTALACVAPHTWIQADAEGNVIVFNIEAQENQLEGADPCSVEYISSMNLGEQVNTIRTLTMANDTRSVLQAQAIMTTAEGGIYLFGILPIQYRTVLFSLQERLTQHVMTLGNFSFAEYRAFRHELQSDKEPVGFVDGELLERFLSMSETMREVVCEGLPISVSEACRIIASLQKLH